MDIEKVYWIWQYKLSGEDLPINFSIEGNKIMEGYWQNYNMPPLQRSCSFENYSSNFCKISPQERTLLWGTPASIIKRVPTPPGS